MVDEGQSTRLIWETECRSPVLQIIRIESLAVIEVVNKISELVLALVTDALVGVIAALLAAHDQPLPKNGRCLYDQTTKV